MPRAFRSDVRFAIGGMLIRVSPCWERRDARLGRHERWGDSARAREGSKARQAQHGAADGVKMIRDVAVR